MTEKLSIILVDDHPAMRRGLRSILEDDFDVVAEAEEPKEAVKKILAYRPDIALIDVKYGSDVMGPSIVKTVKDREPDITCVAFTVSTSRDDVGAMLNAGADGYLTKSTPDEDLGQLLEDAANGKSPTSPEVAGFMADIDEVLKKETPFDGLTKREREVVKMIARGYTYRQSSERLGIKVKTLETHMTNIFKKLGFGTRHEMSQEAWKCGFIDPAEDESASSDTVDESADEDDD